MGSGSHKDILAGLRYVSRDLRGLQGVLGTIKGVPRVSGAFQESHGCEELALKIKCPDINTFKKGVS